MIQNTSLLFKVAEIQLTYKPKISTSKEAYEVQSAHWSLGKIKSLEEFL